MAAPGSDGFFLTSESIKILRRDGGQFLKQRRVEFPPRLTVGARSRRETQLTQRAKDFVERVLQGKFVATQNQHCYNRKCQDAFTSKGRRRRAKFLTRLFRGEFAPQTREELEFVFLFTLLLVPG